MFNFRQALYLKGKSEALREYGYADFIKNYKKDASSRRKSTNVARVTILNMMN